MLDKSLSGNKKTITNDFIGSKLKHNGNFEYDCDVFSEYEISSPALEYIIIKFLNEMKIARYDFLIISFDILNKLTEGSNVIESEYGFEKEFNYFKDRKLLEKRFLIIPFFTNNIINLVIIENFSRLLKSDFISQARIPLMEGEKPTFTFFIFSQLQQINQKYFQDFLDDFKIFVNFYTKIKYGKRLEQILKFKDICQEDINIVLKEINYNLQYNYEYIIIQIILNILRHSHKSQFIENLDQSTLLSYCDEMSLMNVKDEVRVIFKNKFPEKSDVNTSIIELNTSISGRNTQNSKNLSKIEKIYIPNDSQERNTCFKYSLKTANPLTGQLTSLDLRNKENEKIPYEINTKNKNNNLRKEVITMNHEKKEIFLDPINFDTSIIKPSDMNDSYILTKNESENIIDELIPRFQTHTYTSKKTNLLNNNDDSKKKILNNQNDKANLSSHKITELDRRNLNDSKVISFEIDLSKDRRKQELKNNTENIKKTNQIDNSVQNNFPKQVLNTPDNVYTKSAQILNKNNEQFQKANNINKVQINMNELRSPKNKESVSENFSRNISNDTSNNYGNENGDSNAEKKERHTSNSSNPSKDSRTNIRRITLTDLKNFSSTIDALKSKDLDSERKHQLVKEIKKSLIPSEPENVGENFIEKVKVNLLNSKTPIKDQNKVNKEKNVLQSSTPRIEKSNLMNNHNEENHNASYISPSETDSVKLPINREDLLKNNDNKVVQIKMQKNKNVFVPQIEDDQSHHKNEIDEKNKNLNNLVNKEEAYKKKNPLINSKTNNQEVNQIIPSKRTLSIINEEKEYLERNSMSPTTGISVENKENPDPIRTNMKNFENEDNIKDNQKYGNSKNLENEKLKENPDPIRTNMKNFENEDNIKDNQKYGNSKHLENEKLKENPDPIRTNMKNFENEDNIKDNQKYGNSKHLENEKFKKINIPLQMNKKNLNESQIKEKNTSNKDTTSEVLELDHLISSVSIKNASDNNLPQTKGKNYLFNEKSNMLLSKKEKGDEIPKNEGLDVTKPDKALLFKLKKLKKEEDEKKEKVKEGGISKIEIQNEKENLHQGQSINVESKNDNENIFSNKLVDNIVHSIVNEEKLNNQEIDKKINENETKIENRKSSKDDEKKPENQIEVDAKSNEKNQNSLKSKVLDENEKNKKNKINLNQGELNKKEINHDSVLNISQSNERNVDENQNNPAPQSKITINKKNLSKSPDNNSINQNINDKNSNIATLKLNRNENLNKISPLTNLKNDSMYLPMQNQDLSNELSFQNSHLPQSNSRLNKNNKKENLDNSVFDSQIKREFKVNQRPTHSTINKKVLKDAKELIRNDITNDESMNIEFNKKNLNTNERSGCLGELDKKCIIY